MRLHGLAENGPVDDQKHPFCPVPCEEKIEYDALMMDKWAKLIKVRSEITKALEIARRDKVIGHPLEAEVLVQADGEFGDFLKK